MSYARSPRPVCSSTMGTSPLTRREGVPCSNFCCDADRTRLSDAAARLSILAALFDVAGASGGGATSGVTGYGCCAWRELTLVKHTTSEHLPKMSSDAQGKNAKRGFTDDVTLESLRADVASFAAERDWDQARNATQCSLSNHVPGDTCERRVTTILTFAPRCLC